jgi:DNA-binding sugar fermentation-stimulating protein
MLTRARLRLLTSSTSQSRSAVQVSTSKLSNSASDGEKIEIEEKTVVVRQRKQKKVKVRSVTSLPYEGFVASHSLIKPLPSILSNQQIREKVKRENDLIPLFEVHPGKQGQKALEPALVVARPSKSVKTPYVADIMLESRGNGIFQAHTPALDNCGMIVPGSTVYVSRTDGREDDESDTGIESKKKTQYTVWVAQESRLVQETEEICDDQDSVEWAYVACNPASMEKVAFEVLERRYLSEKFGDYDAIAKQVSFGSSRFDLALIKTNEDEEEGDEILWLIEVKMAVAADYPQDRVPADPIRHPVGVITTNTKKPFHRTGMFPVGGTTKSGVNVISDRAIKHIHELSQLQSLEIKESKYGRITDKTRCAVLFIVNREDCQDFRPCFETDPLFARMLYKAHHEHNVEVVAIKLFWCVASGRCWMHKDTPIPVVWEDRCSIPLEDEDGWLQRVLEYNANPETHRHSRPSKRKMEELKQASTATKRKRTTK